MVCPGSLANISLRLVSSLIIAEFALGKRSRTELSELSNIRRKELRLDGPMTVWISTAIGFYYAVVTGWCLNYFQTAVRGGLGSEVDTTEVWNSFLQSPTDVIMFQAIAGNNYGRYGGGPRP